MKTLSLRTLAIVSGLACLNVYPVAQAQSNDWNYPPQVKFESSLSREEVRTEYFKAAQQGTLTSRGEVDASPTIAATTFTSTLSREAVIAETLDWMRTQQSDVMMGGN